MIFVQIVAAGACFMGGLVCFRHGSSLPQFLLGGLCYALGIVLAVGLPLASSVPP